MAFSPDGLRLASSDYSQTITIWDATPMSDEVRLTYREARNLVPLLAARHQNQNEIESAIYPREALKAVLPREQLIAAIEGDRSLSESLCRCACLWRILTRNPWRQATRTSIQSNSWKTSLQSSCCDPTF